MSLLLPVSLALMLLFSVSRVRLLGVTGWFLFSLFWFLKSPYYLSISDYYNTGIVILAGIFFILLAYTIAVSEERKIEILSRVTLFSSLAGIVYFPFAFIPALNRWLISEVTSLILSTGHLFGYNFSLYSWNIIESNGKYIEIILACTAIESIALFTAASFGAGGEMKRRVMAFVISVIPIFILNIFRNVFVILAYSYSWFGENSFYIAHHILAKIGSTIALIIIAYAVFTILPELEELIIGLKDAMVDALRGKRV